MKNNIDMGELKMTGNICPRSTLEDNWWGILMCIKIGSVIICTPHH